MIGKHRNRKKKLHRAAAIITIKCYFKAYALDHFLFHTIIIMNIHYSRAVLFYMRKQRTKRGSSKLTLHTHSLKPHPRQLACSLTGSYTCAAGIAVDAMEGGWRETARHRHNIRFVL